MKLTRIEIFSRGNFTTFLSHFQHENFISKFYSKSIAFQTLHISIFLRDIKYCSVERVYKSRRWNIGKSVKNFCSIYNRQCDPIDESLSVGLLRESFVLSSSFRKVFSSVFLFAALSSPTKWSSLHIIGETTLLEEDERLVSCSSSSSQCEKFLSVHRRSWYIERESSALKLNILYQIKNHSSELSRRKKWKKSNKFSGRDQDSMLYASCWENRKNKSFSGKKSEGGWRKLEYNKLNCARVSKIVQHRTENEKFEKSFGFRFLEMANFTWLMLISRVEKISIFTLKCERVRESSDDGRV